MLLLAFVSDSRKEILGREFNATRVSISIDLNVIDTIASTWKPLCPKHIGRRCRRHHQ